MEKINMNYKRLSNLLNVCSVDELGSFDILLTQVKKYDLSLINRLFKMLVNKKSDSFKSEFEGMRDFDLITRLKNFKITNITNYAINPYELIFLKKLMVDAVTNINKDKNPLYLDILPNIEEAIERINTYLGDLPDVGYLNDEELEKMFNKFKASEIEKFDDIFESIEMYNIENMMNIADKVYNEKRRGSTELADVIELSNKNNTLNKKELYLLRDIVTEAARGLMNNEEEYDINQYKKLDSSLWNLRETYVEELDKRNRKKYTKTLKPKK